MLSLQMIPQRHPLKLASTGGPAGWPGCPEAKADEQRKLWGEAGLGSVRLMASPLPRP